MVDMSLLKQQDLVLTPRGWDRVSELERGKAGMKPLQAFVAMWFSPEVQTAFEEGIRPAIIDAGFDPLRIDSKEHISKIDDEIISEIRKSRFVVADFTGGRGGVYYEAGFAMGLGIDVVWTCRKDCMEKLHFDIQQYNMLDWENPEELRERLTHRIGSVIGPPPNEGST